MPSTESHRLLQRLREHPDDAEAWRHFDTRYRPVLQTWLRRYGLQPHDADDLVQQVLAVAVRNSGAPGGHGPGRPATAVPNSPGAAGVKLELKKVDGGARSLGRTRMGEVGTSTDSPLSEQRT
jgi:hypothetical protein